MSVLPRVIRTVVAVPRLRRSDVMLAAFPKTGSSWVRFTVLEYLRRASSDSGPALTHERVNAVMPEFPHPSLGAAWPFDGVPRLVKTHWRWTWVFPRGPHVLLVRDPHDLMVSMWRYLNGVRTIPGEYTLDEVIAHPRYGVGAFVRHWRSWQGHVRSTLAYEALVRHPLEEFSELLKSLELPVDHARLRTSLEATRPDRMQEAERGSRVATEQFHDGFEFTRPGSVGRSMDILAGEQRDRIDEALDLGGYVHPPDA